MSARRADNHQRKSWKRLLVGHESVLLAILVLEWIYFDSVGRHFGSLDNTYDILRHSSEIGLLALALTPIILTGGIDLSVASLLGLCAILFGKMWRDGHFPLGVAAVGALAFGATGGGINAWFITRLRLPPLIVTLGTFSLFRGLAEAITHGVDTFTGFPDAFLALGQGRWLGLPAQVPLFLGVAIGIWLSVHRTVWGRSCRAIGFAPEGALYAGVPVQRRVASVYVLAGLIAGLAAIIYTARLGQAKADAATGYELFAITAVVLGGTSIFGGVGSVHGTLLGIGAIAVLNNGLVHARQPREAAGLLVGVLLLVSLAASVVVKRVATRRASRYSATDTSTQPV